MGYAIAKQLGIEYVRNRTVGENDAVMFDIDETLFQSNGEPIQDVIDLFHECDRLGYRIIIITARPDYAVNHHYTQVQLTSYGLYPHEVYFVPPEDKDAIKDQTGLHYVLSVGDLCTDLGRSDAFIKLPDRFDTRVYTNIT
jgi:hypothetical protein